MQTEKVYYFPHRYGIGKILADYECCICTKRKTASSGSGYEQLEKCVTENGARTLQQAGLHDEYPFLQSEVGAGVDWQTIIAREYYYHRSCYKKVVRKRDAKKAAVSATDKVFDEVVKHIEEKLINDFEVLRMSDISRLYSEIAEQFSGVISWRDSMISNQKLKERIQTRFGAKVGFWRPSYGSELLFNDNVDKGQLVEVAVRAKLANREWCDKTVEEKTTEVAREIRKELLETPSTYERYIV